MHGRDQYRLGLYLLWDQQETDAEETASVPKRNSEAGLRSETERGRQLLPCDEVAARLCAASVFYWVETAASVIRPCLGGLNLCNRYFAMR